MFVSRLCTGYSNRPRGYYDAEGHGKGPVDYGRWVGNHPNTWWSVVLLSEPGNQYSPPGAFSQPDVAVLVPEIKVSTTNRPASTCIGDWGALCHPGKTPRPRAECAVVCFTRVVTHWATVR